MRAKFEKAIVPCVCSDVVLWHLKHGWVWNVVELPAIRRCGVFYCTLLCGDGCVVHFDTVPGLKLSWVFIHAAMKRSIRMIAPLCNVVYATIPEEKESLIRVCFHLGFRKTDGGFLRDGMPIALLKYYPRQNAILKK